MFKSVDNIICLNGMEVYQSQLQQYKVLSVLLLYLAETEIYILDSDLIFECN